MRLFNSLWALALCAAPLASAKEWTFTDATVSTQGKGAGDGGRFVKEKLTPNKPLQAAVTLSSQDTLQLTLTAQDGKTPKRPHQAFLTLSDPATNLEDSYPLKVKADGKGSVTLAHKDLPAQFAAATTPLRATLTLASFGSSEPYTAPAFELTIAHDAAKPPPRPSPPARYGKQPEIHHEFSSGPSSPPAFVTASFACFVFTLLPVLLGVWLTAGANVAALPEAFAAAPVAHALFVGSLVGLEAILLAYYVGLTLFQVLPAIGVVGAVAFLSGSRALSEVQGRRLAGKR